MKEALKKLKKYREDFSRGILYRKHDITKVLDDIISEIENLQDPYEIPDIDELLICDPVCKCIEIALSLFDDKEIMPKPEYSYAGEKEPVCELSKLKEEIIRLEKINEELTNNLDLAEKLIGLKNEEILSLLKLLNKF